MVATTEAGPESRALSGLVVTLLVVAVAGVIPLERRRRKWEQEEEEEERQERDRALNELFHGEDLLDEADPEEYDDWVVSMTDDRPMNAVCDEVFAACDNNWSQDSVGWRAPRLDNFESPVAVSLRQPRVTRGEHVAARRREAMLIRNARREGVSRRPLLCRSSVVWLAACLLLGAFCFGGAAWFSSVPDRPAARAAVPASAPVTYVTKNIEDVRKGETVVAWDPVTGELGRHEVTNTFERTSDHLRVLEFAAESDGQTQTLETTDEHPFWSVEAGDFVAAGDLRLGDRFISPAGEFSTLRATHRDEHPEGVPVYNFEVADVHNYYVRAHGLRAPPIRVHNAQGYGGGGQGRTRWGKEHGKGNVAHNDAIEDVLDGAHLRGATDLRKNRVQRDVAGNRVFAPDGKYVRPDASFVENGVRHNHNRVSSLDDIEREVANFLRMIRADAHAIHSLEF